MLSCGPIKVTVYDGAKSDLTPLWQRLRKTGPGWLGEANTGLYSFGATRGQPACD